MNIPPQAILSLASGFLTLVVFGSIYTFGAMTPYLSSYLFYKGDETKDTALSLLFTSTLLMINVGTAISGMFFAKKSNRIMCIVAIVGLSVNVFISSFMEKFIGFVLFYGIGYGFFIGFGYFGPVKNAYLHLPLRKGLCSGICMSGFGMGSAIFNYIIVALVNPKNQQKVGKLYPIDVANNVPFALKVIAGIYLGMGLLGAFFIIPPSKKKVVKNYTLLSEETIVGEKTQIQAPEPISKAFQLFKKKKAYMIMLQIGFMAPFGMFLAFNYKRLAQDRNTDLKQNDHLITTIGSIGIFCNGAFRMGWGYLFDHISYKKITICINICLMAFCGLCLLAVESVPSYAIFVPLVYLAYGGLYAITPTQSVRVLGKDVGTKLFWLVFAGFSLSGIIQFTVQYFCLPHKDAWGYQVCLGIFFFLEVVALVLNIITNFEYEPGESIVKKKINALESEEN